MIDFKILDQLKASYNQLPSRSVGVADKYHEDMIIRWTYHSNAIEGNTLTLKETKVALEGITVAGKSITEHLEAINHKEAILFVERLASNDNNALTEHDIKSLHALVLQKVDDQNAGKYRNEDVIISGANHKPPSFLAVPQQMTDFVKWHHNNVNKLHPIELSARVHTDFVGIHPFIDGNGRTARLLMNLTLLKAKFPVVIIKNEDKLNYYQALDEAHTKGNYQPFIHLVSQSLKENLQLAIAQNKAKQAVKDFNQPQDRSRTT